MRIKKIQVLCKKIDSAYEHGENGLISTGQYKIFYEDGTSKTTSVLYMSQSNEASVVERVMEFDDDN